MKLTGIEKINLEYCEPLLPQGGMIQDQAEIYLYSELTNPRKTAVANFLKKQTGTRGFIFSMDPYRKADRQGKCGKKSGAVQIR